MTDTQYAAFPHLKTELLDSGVLVITFDGPGLNAVGIELHGEIADIWPVVDRDPRVKAVVVQGAGKGFSSGGSFELLDAMTNDYAVRTRVLREARDLVRNLIDCSKPIISAIHG